MGYPSTEAQRPNHVVIGGMLLTSLVLSACMMETSELSYEEGEIQSNLEAIRDGIYVGYHKGLLELQTGAGFCTATMIAERYAVTAAHCMPFSGSQREGWFQMTIRYFDPDTLTKRLVTGTNESLYAWAIPTWDNPSSGIDYQDDLALIRRSSDWTSTDSTDYVRINGGTSSGSVFDIYPMDVYGRGFFTTSGTGSGVLRRAPVIVNGANTHALWDLEGSRALCKGDSGGPWMGTTSGFRVVAGVWSGSDMDGGNCTADGEEQYAARTNSRLSWMMGKMPAGTCTMFAHYTKCF